jgi:hypothetical protein
MLLTTDMQAANIISKPSPSALAKRSCYLLIMHTRQGGQTKNGEVHFMPAELRYKYANCFLYMHECRGKHPSVQFIGCTKSI